MYFYNSKVLHYLHCYIILHLMHLLQVILNYKKIVISYTYIIYLYGIYTRHNYRLQCKKRL